jgi:hypothetical protein
MRGQRFRISSPTVAIDGTETKILHMSVGCEVTVVGETSDSNQLVGVMWNGRAVLMFARDLVERGERIPDADAASANKSV